ncbi:MAG: hypothetical protein U0Q18_09335 [Bryobacteraceae bacterium]
MANALTQFVRFALILALWLAPVWGATLERLTLDEMIAKSTAIVHGRVAGSYSAFRGSVIYTHFKINVTEQFKGSSQGAVDVVVPGGLANGIRQSYPGAPQLSVGQDYLLFLWTSKSGVTYTIGFTQGVFTLPVDASGEVIAVRAATTETMLEPLTGRALKDEPLRMPLSSLVARIKAGVKAQ